MNTAFRICLFSVLVLGGAAASAQEWAAKMFDETSHDFRSVARGSKCEYHFEFKNIYKEDVHVASVRSSCGCTTPSVTKSTLHTRDTSAVVATFNTTSFSGSKSATITVVFDRPYYAEVRLQVTGYIRTDVEVEPAEIAFGEVPEGQTKEVAVKVTRRGQPNWRIEDVRSECTDLGVRLGKPQVANQAVQYPLVVRMKESMPVGDVRHRLTLVTNEKNASTIELSVSGRVRPSLTVSPFAWNIGTLDPKATVEKRLMVRGDQPFELREIVCDDERFSFDVPEGSKKIHFVKATFTAGADLGKVTEQIQIVSSLPGDRSIHLVATGEVKP